jgi:hypothetical protein
MSYKVFSNGNVLNASELNEFLMNQSVIAFSNATARSSAITSPIEGMITYLEDSNSYQSYDGSAWVGLVPQSPNAIINGAFDIWQRGTSFAAAAGGQVYTADRFGHDRNGTGATVTISRQNFTPGAAPQAGYESEYFLRVDQSVAGTGQTFNTFDQRVEDVRTFAGQTVTFSFWAKASTAETLRRITLTQLFGSGGSTSVSVSSPEITLTTSWARYSVTLDVPSVSGKTIGANSFLRAQFLLPLNETFTIDIWGVQLEAGSVATPFRRNANSLQGELAVCQRYYQRISLSSGNGVFGNYGAAVGTTQALIPFPNKSTMRVTPTSIEFSNLQLSDGSGGFPASNVSIWGPSTPDTPYALVTSSGLTSFRPLYLTTSGAGSSFLAFSAEL